MTLTNATLDIIPAGSIIRAYKTAPLTWRLDGFGIDNLGRTRAYLHCLTDTERTSTLPLAASVWVVERNCPNCGRSIEPRDTVCAVCPTCTDCGTTDNVTQTDDDPLCSDCRNTRSERNLEGDLFNYEAKREDFHA